MLVEEQYERLSKRRKTKLARLFHIAQPNDEQSATGAPDSATGEETEAPGQTAQHRGGAATRSHRTNCILAIPSAGMFLPGPRRLVGML